MRTFLTSLALLLAVVAVNANAQVQITYGNVEGSSRFVDLLPNQAGQQVQLFVTGLAAAGGADAFEFNSFIGNNAAGPLFEALDFTTGTVLAGKTQTDVVVQPRASRVLVDNATVVTADGLLGTITFDTTGLSAGLWDFQLNNVAGSFDTRFTLLSDPVPTNAPDGFLRIQAVPEPSMAILGALGLGGLILRRRR